MEQLFELIRLLENQKMQSEIIEHQNKRISILEQNYYVNKLLENSRNFNNNDELKDSLSDINH